jgi:hypothetical protein
MTGSLIDELPEIKADGPEMPQGDRVKTHQPNDREAKRRKRQIEHDCLLARAVHTFGARKVSMPIARRSNKETVKIGTTELQRGQRLAILILPIINFAQCNKRGIAN